MAGIQKIRDNLTGTISKVIVSLAILTLALFFGWGTVFSSSDVNTIASVNGKKIDLFDLDLEMARVQSILKSRFDNTNFTLDDDMLRSISINSLIRDALVLDYLDKNKVKISDLTAYRVLAENEIFLENGKFSPNKVDSFARQNGMLPGKYLGSVKKNIALELWINGLTESSFITRKEIEKNLKLTNQSRDITFLRLNNSMFEKDLEFPDELVLDFYNRNTSLFQTEEKAKVRFIEISLEDLKNKVSVREEEIRKEYEDYRKNFDSSARRSVSHLMISITNEIQEIEAISIAKNLKQRVILGEEFETLVATYSEDEGTRNSKGVLGISDGTAFPQEFESVLRGLKVGDISDPVVLDKGVHLLKLTNIKNPKPEDFDLMKEMLKEDLTLELASSEFIEQLETVADLTFSINSLEDLSEEAQLEIIETNFFTRSQPEGRFKKEVLLEKVFNDSEVQLGQLSELIELNEELAIIFEILEFQDKKIKEFGTVKEIVKIELRNKVLKEKKDSMQNKILAALESGETLSKISTQEAIEIKSYKEIGRDSSLFPKAVLFEIFNVPRSIGTLSYSVAALPGGDRIIFAVDKVNESSKLISDEEIALSRDFFSKERSESELVALQIIMQQEASISQKGKVN